MKTKNVQALIKAAIRRSYKPYIEPIIDVVPTTEDNITKEVKKFYDLDTDTAFRGSRWVMFRGMAKDASSPEKAFNKLSKIKATKRSSYTGWPGEVILNFTTDKYQYVILFFEKKIEVKRFFAPKQR